MSKKHPVTLAIILLCLIGLAMVASVAIGSRPIPLQSSLDALTHYTPTNDEHLIVRGLRIPRTLLAALAGAALAIAGVIVQALTRNPLAEPGTLAINAGAACGVVIGLSFFPGASVNEYVWFSLAGAVLAMALIYRLGRDRRGGLHPVRLILAGAGLTMSLSSLTTIMVLTHSDAVFDTFRSWVTGSLQGKQMDHVPMMVLCTILGFVIAMVLARSLDAVTLGHDMAVSVGTHLQRTWMAANIAIVILAGGATAIIGPVSFVGLAAPPRSPAPCGPTPPVSDTHQWPVRSTCPSPCRYCWPGRSVPYRDRCRSHDSNHWRTPVYHVGSPWRIEVPMTSVHRSTAHHGQRLRIHAGPIRLSTTRKTVTASLVCLAIITLCLVTELSRGAMTLSPHDVFHALTSPHAPATHRLIVLTIRLPRALTALGVGAALGMSGAIFQALSRNPLGSPDIIGLTKGAAMGAALAIVLAGAHGAMVPAAAVSVAFCVAVVILLLARKGGRTSPTRLILSGIGASSFMGAITTIVLERGREEAALRARLWLSGSVNARSYDDVLWVTIAILICLPVLAVISRSIFIMTCGDDLASGLGVRVERVRMLAVGCAVLLTAGAVAAAGPIAFIALAAPQIIRRVADFSSLHLGPSALCGSALLLTADSLSLWAPQSWSLPVGLVTASLGGIYLMWLVTHHDRF